MLRSYFWCFVAISGVAGVAVVAGLAAVRGDSRHAQSSFCQMGSGGTGYKEEDLQLLCAVCDSGGNGDLFLGDPHHQHWDDFQFSQTQC